MREMGKGKSRRGEKGVRQGGAWVSGPWRKGTENERTGEEVGGQHTRDGRQRVKEKG